MPIQLLPISLANQIAAGEVVERPASVVKELVENSLDAGASKIDIVIEQGGAKRILIRDNGSGIEQAELALALSRHATSKISTLADLEAILSLGFRGEALASISSVSRLRLTSKPAAQATAWQAWVEGLEMAVQTAPAAHPNGTSVDVVDLFYNTPARRKFLRTEKTEFGHIDEVVKRIALARFDVSFSLEHQHKRVRDLRAIANTTATEFDLQGGALQRVAQLCGKAFADTALVLHEQQGPWQLRGWLAPPEHCRHQSDVQYLYVNGRMMRDRLLLHAVRQAYGERLAEDRSAAFVLYLQVPTSDVDINVHPAKHEVRFHQARQIHDFVVAVLKQALAQVAELPDTGTDVVAERPREHAYQSHTAVDLSAFKPRHSTPLPGLKAGPRAVTPSSPAPLPSPATAPSWRVLSVLDQHYALLQSATAELALLSLAPVCQQATATKLAEQFSQGLSGQPLLVPVKLGSSELQQWQQLQRQANEPWLSKLGIVATRQQQGLKVEQVPACLRQTDITQTLPALLARLQTLTTAAAAEQPDLWRELWWWLASLATPSQFSLTQAEHWLQYWSQQLRSQPKQSAAAQWLTPLPWRAALPGAEGAP